jgi:serine/threonine protein kinase
VGERDPDAIAETAPASDAAPAAHLDTLAVDPGAVPTAVGLPVVSREVYRIDGELGRGGMGRVLRARDQRIGRPVAIKEVLAPGGALAARFEREALITARLQHPAIVPVYECGRWPDGEPFYAMKLVAGRPLDEVIKGARDLAARAALLPSVVAVCEALAYAHDRKVIHRDLKPGNVLVGDFGETVVVDWGLAKDLGASDEEVATTSAGTAADMTTAGGAIGTPAYMAPEQAKGGAIDERADVYALGALLYHLLAGDPPYAGSSSAKQVIDDVAAGKPPAPLATRVPDAPRELIAIVERALG